MDSSASSNRSFETTGSGEKFQKKHYEQSRPRIIHSCSIVQAELRWIIQQISRRNVDEEVQQVPVQEIWLCSPPALLLTFTLIN